MKLKQEFYIREDVVTIARELLGKVICTRIKGVLTSGIITETEAYAGVLDRASHAFGNRRTKRTETMLQEGGVAYVYLCYGVHHLFNFVTNIKDVPQAILLRGIFPIEGIDWMEKRMEKRFSGKEFTNGPGKLSKAMGIKTKHDGTSLSGSKIWVEDVGIQIGEKEIYTGPRIGVDYAGSDTQLPYRFLIVSPEWIQKSLP